LEEEEFDEDDDDDDDEELVATCDEATHESISARPRGAKCDGGADDRTDSGRPKNSLLKTTDDLDDNNDEELYVACDEATWESISARPRGAKLDRGANNRTDGSRPKNSLLKTTGDPAYDDEELDDGDTEDEEDLEDDGKTAQPDRAEALPIFFGNNRGGALQWGSRTGRKHCQFFPPGTPVQKRGQGPWCSDPGTSDL